MSETTKSTATISALPWNCLVKIFLHIPLVERMELRKVCKIWRDNVDHCWSSVKFLTLYNSVYYSVAVNNVGSHQSTRDFSRMERLITNCSPYLRTLNIIGSTYTLPVIAEKCQHLEDLCIDNIASKAQDQALCALLKNNPNMKSLSLSITNEIAYKFFDHLSVDVFEVLRLSIVPRMSYNNVEASPIDMRSLQQLQTVIIRSVKNFIAKSNGLRILKVNCASAELLKVIGGKKNLEFLEIGYTKTHKALDFGHCDAATKWSYLFSLKSLKTIKISELFGFDRHGDYITDDTVEELTRCCPLLEFVELQACRYLTDRSIRALSSLQHLRKLHIYGYDGSRSITDQFLMYFTNIEELNLEDDEGVNDAGVIRLLCSCQTLRSLRLSGTNITHKTLSVAIEETKKRTNGVKLKIYVEAVDISKVKNTSTLLEIIGY